MDGKTAQKPIDTYPNIEMLNALREQRDMVVRWKSDPTGNLYLDDAGLAQAEKVLNSIIRQMEAPKE